MTKLQELSPSQCQKQGFFSAQRASNSKATYLIRPKFELIRGFIVVLVSDKFYRFDKTTGAGTFTMSKTGFFFTKGQVTPTDKVRFSRNSNWSELFNDCPGYLQVLLRSDQKLIT